MWICLSLFLGILIVINIKYSARPFYLDLYLRSFQLFIEFILFIWLIIGIRYEVYQESNLCFYLYAFWIGIATFTLLFFFTRAFCKYLQKLRVRSLNKSLVFSAIYFFVVLIKVYPTQDFIAIAILVSATEYNGIER